MKAKRIPSELLDAVRYSKKTGNLYWKVRPITQFATQRAHAVWNARFVGTRAGYVNNQGYRVLKFQDEAYKEHRVIACILSGKDNVDKQVDHRNCKRSDNRPDNIRRTNGSRNCMNQGVRRNNTSGYKNITRHARKDLWVINVTANGKTVTKRRKDLSAAIKVRDALLSELHGKYARYE